MNWKKQFNKDFQCKNEDNSYCCDEIDRFNIEEVTDFISTEIIEKLIDDIYDELGSINSDGNRISGYPTSNLKQQLKDKWL